MKNNTFIYIILFISMFTLTACPSNSDEEEDNYIENSSGDLTGIWIHASHSLKYDYDYIFEFKNGKVFELELWEYTKRNDFLNSYNSPSNWKDYTFLNGILRVGNFSSAVTLSDNSFTYIDGDGKEQTFNRWKGTIESFMDDAFGKIYTRYYVSKIIQEKNKSQKEFSFYYNVKGFVSEFRDKNNEERFTYTYGNSSYDDVIVVRSNKTYGTLSYDGTLLEWGKSHTFKYKNGYLQEIATSKNKFFPQWKDNNLMSIYNNSTHKYMNYLDNTFVYSTEKNNSNIDLNVFIHDHFYIDECVFGSRRPILEPLGFYGKPSDMLLQGNYGEFHVERNDQNLPTKVSLINYDNKNNDIVLSIEYNKKEIEVKR